MYAESQILLNLLLKGLFPIFHLSEIQGVCKFDCGILSFVKLYKIREFFLIHHEIFTNPFLCLD